MKPFNLKEYLENPSRKVVTRNGKPVKIHCTNYVTHRQVIAEIEGSGCSESFSREGRYYNDIDNSSNDLFFAPEKHEGWVNIYRSSANSNDPYCFNVIYTSEEEARRKGGTACATVKIEWEE